MLTQVRSIMISAPKESVQMYLRDLKNMTAYEQKVQAVSTQEEPLRSSCRVEASGRFLFMPWRGAFEVTFTPDGGYRGEMVEGPLRRMENSYHLRAVSGGTILTHEESYLFPLLFRPLALTLKGWLARTMDLELGVIKEGSELMNRRIQLQKAEL